MKQEEQLEAQISQLGGSLKGSLLRPEQEGFEKARAIWNGAVSSRPGLIVIPETLNDVQLSVRFAVSNKLPLSVKGGGHDWVGRSLNDDGVVISLEKLKSVVIDPASGTAIVGGGITARDLIAESEPLGFVAVTGTVGVVGLAGLTLGGGYGPLSPSFGLAADNLLGAEIVLADGSVVNASREEHPDLFWALRGGGGNFGVVTKMKVRLHPAKPLLSGMILYPWEQAPAVFAGYSDLMANAPDELAAFAGMMPDPQGNPQVFIIPVCYGESAAGKAAVDRLQELGKPSYAELSRMAYSEFLGIFDPHIVNGQHYAIHTRWLPELDPVSVDVLFRGALERPSAASFINIHHFHGAAARMHPGDAAFGMRKTHFMMEFIAAWQPKPSETGQAHHRWAKNLSTGMAAQAFPGGYANLLSPTESDQSREAYGPNKERLLQVKRTYDSGNVFKGISLPGKID